MVASAFSRVVLEIVVRELMAKDRLARPVLPKIIARDPAPACAIPALSGCANEARAVSVRAIELIYIIQFNIKTDVCQLGLGHAGRAAF